MLLAEVVLPERKRMAVMDGMREMVETTRMHTEDDLLVSKMITYPETPTARMARR